MPTYDVQFTSAAAKRLTKLDRPVRRRLAAAIALLAEDPRPAAAKPLVGRPAWRLRVGDWRIIYTVDDGALVVLVIALGHRSHVYDP